MNQDILRTSLDAIAPATVMTALRWLDADDGSFPRPVSVHLDLTFRCTARCGHCSQWTWAEHPELGIDQIESLLETFRRWGVQTLTIGGGNPLLHPHLAHLLRRCNESGVAAGLITEGGVKLPPKVMDAISQHLDWIRFSIDGPSADIHDRIRNSKGLFHQTTAMIRRFRSLTSPTTIGINCVIQRRNVDRLADMVSLASDLDVDALLFKLPHGEDRASRYLPTSEAWNRILTWARDQPDDVRPATNLRQLTALLGSLLDPMDVAAGSPVRSFYTARRARCYIPLFFLVIDARGDVYPCDYLQADTRPMSHHYQQMRTQFVAGNVFSDGDGVLDRVGDLLRAKVHELPGQGYPECGSCTRFFQFNAHVGEIDSKKDEIDFTSTARSTPLGNVRQFL